MVKSIALFICLFLAAWTVQAQQLNIDISHDTIAIGSTFDITYQVDESCIPKAMEFEDFDIVSGPNVSKTMSYTNGILTAETSLSFTLKAREEGTFTLPDSLCDLKSKQEPVIVVSKDTISKGIEKTKPSKKRKIKKI